MPAAIGAALLPAAIASTTVVAGVTVASAVGWAVIIGGAVGLGLLLMPSAETAAGQSNPQRGTQTLRQTKPVRQAAVGRCRLRGAFMLYVEQDGDSIDVIAFCEGTIGGYVQFYLHDDTVVLTGDDVSAVAGVDGAPLGKGEGVTSGNDGRYVGFVSIHFRLGLPAEAAYSAVTSRAPDIWTTDHRGDGIASAALICNGVLDQEEFQDIYPNGLPNLSAVGDWLPCWDGRDGNQDPDDPTTWQQTTNPILQLIFFLTDSRVGMGFDREQIIDPVIDQLMAQADLCDQEGYESAGGWSLEEAPADIIKRILATCDGWIAEDGEGHLIITAGVYHPPTFTIDWSQGDILSFAPNLGVDDETAVNVLNFTYTSPDHDYREIAGDPWRDEADIAARGQERARDLSLSWVQNHEQARKLAKHAMSRLMSSARGRMSTTLYGLGALGKRWIGLRVPFIAGLEAAVIEIENVEVDFNAMRVSFDWIKIDGVSLAVFDPVTEGGVAPPAPPPSNPNTLNDNDDAVIQDNDGANVLA